MFELVYTVGETSIGIHLNKSLKIGICDDTVLLVVNDVVEIYFQTEDVMGTAYQLKKCSFEDTLGLWDRFSNDVTDVIFRGEGISFRCVYDNIVTESGQYSIETFSAKKPLLFESFR
jgi:hypothetical protein